MNEEKLKNAASEAARRMLDTLPEDCDHDFSPRFQKKMGVLLRRERSSTFPRTLRWVASIAMVLIVSATLLLLSPEVRAAVLFWQVTEEGDGFYREDEYIGLDPDNVQENLRYELGWIPEGCWLSECQDWGNEVCYIYHVSENIRFFFSYCFGDGGFSVFSYDMDKTEATVNGMPATLYIHKWPHPSYTLVWEDTETGYILCIDVNAEYVDLETVYRMAENVIKIS